MEQPEKTFTLEEANQLLGQIAPLIQRLQQLHQSILTTNQQLDEAADKLSQGNGYPITDLQTQIEELTASQRRLVEDFQSSLEHLERLGGVLKDLTQGLVDFYAIRDGEIVFLCWRMGEEHIQFWHSVEDGFAGRQPL